MENKETIYELPEDWILTTLGEIGIVVSGGTPSSRQPDFWGGDIAWITPADLSNYKNKYIEQGQRSITKVGLDNSSAKLLPKGTILFSSRAPIGYTVIAKNDIATNQGFKNLILTKSGYSDYIYYYLQASKQLAESYASGTTFLELSATKFSQIPFPLPPLEEQYRIVDKIEELFSELDKAQENLLNAKKQLEIYKRVILKDAFNNFKSWKSYKLSELYYFIGGGTPSKKRPELWNGKINWASVKDIKNMFLTDTIDTITEDGANNSSVNIANINDVIIVTRISPGKVTIAKKEIAINQDLKIVRPIIKEIDHRFTYYLFRNLENIIINISKGTTVKGIRITELNDIAIKLPILDVQKEIVVDIDQKNSLIDNLVKSIEENLKRVEIFRQTIFRKAFSGELVPQIQNVEHASELLRKIYEEKRAYQIRQKEIVKSLPKKLIFMESNKTVREILEDANEPIDAKEIWQKSKHKDDIEKFYEELKQLSANIVEIREGKISKLFLKK